MYQRLSVSIRINMRDLDGRIGIHHDHILVVGRAAHPHPDDTGTDIIEIVLKDKTFVVSTNGWYFLPTS
ncbi:hypothetical protein [Citrobacter portucalensis]|uniref:hypothetical protein n=1 Tax=Citrobacter portucalensis TaxID=1639133 RepID=UPI003CE99A02